jgi:hypothetical protein
LGFNTFDGRTLTYRDEVGQELPTREAAWEMATRVAAECLRDINDKLRCNEEWRLEVVARDRSRVFQIVIHADDLAGRQR